MFGCRVPSVRVLDSPAREREIAGEREREREREREMRERERERERGRE